ncbi:MAG TPA: trypsin-like peptidase domain-containing protein, partial [Gemmatimonadales bacterium]|nr:trypsin-like peptidase domain-containing protein [Gemmatimonadales bacterium]
MPRSVVANAGRLALVALIAACGDSTASALRTSQAGAQAAARPAARPAATPRPVPAETSAAIDASRRTALVAAVERASAAVVSINVTSRQEARARSPWDFFFVPDRSRVVEGYGTGFIVRPTGVIVTNQHVVANAERVVVTLPDGSDLPARVLGEDPLTDIAVLKVDRSGLP